MILRLVLWADAVGIKDVVVDLHAQLGGKTQKGRGLLVALIAVQVRVCLVVRRVSERESFVVFHDAAAGGFVNTYTC